MANHTVVSSIFVSLVFTSLITLVCDAIESDDESSKLYIVYMGSLPKGASYSPTSHHVSLLQHVIDGSDIENRLVRSYKRSFNGFAAILNAQEREKLVRMRGVVSVFPNQDFHLQTTRSWDFVGLPHSFKRYQTIESDLVIGVIDSGIWAESKSFNDKGIYIHNHNHKILSVIIIINCLFLNNYHMYKILPLLKLYIFNYLELFVIIIFS